MLTRLPDMPAGTSGPGGVGEADDDVDEVVGATGP